MADIEIYETKAITARLTEDGLVAVLTLTATGLVPVTIRLSRESLSRFVDQASQVLSAKPLPDAKS